MSRRLIEPSLVILGSFLLASVMTYPLVARMATLGRTDTDDGKLSVWNVAWVARTIVVDPVHLFDANIFYPNRSTLAYSESNIGAGLLAVPAYWLSGGDPHVAHNFVVLLSFTLSAAGMYFLVRHLTGDRRAAAVSAILFAYCPHVLAHTAHIQLMMTAGLPFSLLAFHRLVERPTAGRGIQLGAIMAAQAVSCGYYGVFLMLMIGVAVVVTGVGRRLFTLSHAKALAVGALTALAAVAPFFWPYLRLQRSTGFARDLSDAIRYSADWGAYLASSSYAHAWMLPYVGHWNEVLFPGFLATAGGVAGAWLAVRSRKTELFILYGGLAFLAVWTSFGPHAGLYRALYRVLPVFAWMRAPARFGLIVVFALAVLTGIGLSLVLPKNRTGTLVGLVIAGLATGELALPFPAVPVPQLSPAYRTLKTLPRAPVIEMPFFYPEVGLYQHTIYMLNSTSHWMPLVNGYSDYIPPDFWEHVRTLAAFPSRDAFKILEPLRVRYVMFHLYGYNEENRHDVMGRLKEFETYLRPLYVDENTRLYEIVGFPP